MHSRCAIGVGEHPTMFNDHTIGALLPFSATLCLLVMCSCVCQLGSATIFRPPDLKRQMEVWLRLETNLKVEGCVDRSRQDRQMTFYHTMPIRQLNHRKVSTVDEIKKDHTF